MLSIVLFVYLYTALNITGLSIFLDKNGVLLLIRGLCSPSSKDKKTIYYHSKFLSRSEATGIEYRQKKKGKNMEDKVQKSIKKAIDGTLDVSKTRINIA